MKNFIICFYEDAKIEEKYYQNGDMLRVNEKEMFKWIEIAHIQRIRITICEYTIVCDLS